MPRPTKPIGELLSGSGGRSLTICPECEREGFYTDNTWSRKGESPATRYRTRRCRFCGHARTEKVTTVVEEV